MLRNLTFCLLMLFVFSCKENGRNASEHGYTNDLINETSPYLLQHAHNPVNWRAWDESVLADAKKQDKLVLVSIGYSSCHWCHVMEEETFEDEATAQMMNENFINIKVDREERPDVDQIYQIAVQLVKGRGGWPLNVILLPNGKPLYGDTYHTKEQWNQILTEVSTRYRNNPEEANAYADRLAAGVQEVNLIKPATDFEGLTEDVLTTNLDQWKTQWDLDWGGDLGVEKRMLPVNIDFLMDYGALKEDSSVLSHTKTTLDRMMQGGVYDHVGGGFFRYSTDAFWKIPHFEKMLYDNAQLISLYAKASARFENEAYKDVVIQTISFLDREMKNPEGGYYAAMDADSEGEEGKFYTWTSKELETILGSDFLVFKAYYGITIDNVWENNSYVLHTEKEDVAFAEENSLSAKELRNYKTRWKEKLLNARQERISPHLDDKIITSWNALLISGFVDAYAVFGTQEYLEKAINIFDFLKTHSLEGNKLSHSYIRGGKPIAGFLEDYAFMMQAAIKLYGVTQKEEYLDFANELSKTVTTDFSDTESGMFTYSKTNELISQIIKTNDGVLPSPNAIMAQNLFQLGHINYDTEALKKSKTMLSSLLPAMTESVANYSKWNHLFLQTVYPYYEIAVVGPESGALLKELYTLQLPNVLVVGSEVSNELPLFKGRFVSGDTYIYVCQNSTCKLPVSSVEEALKQLASF